MNLNIIKYYRRLGINNSPHIFCARIVGILIFMENVHFMLDIVDNREKFELLHVEQHIRLPTHNP